MSRFSGAAFNYKIVQLDSQSRDPLGAGEIVYLLLMYICRSVAWTCCMFPEIFAKGQVLFSLDMKLVSSILSDLLLGQLIVFWIDSGLPVCESLSGLNPF